MYFFDKFYLKRKEGKCKVKLLNAKRGSEIGRSLKVGGVACKQIHPTVHDYLLLLLVNPKLAGFNQN